jgi:hypothetical protein
MAVAHPLAARSFRGFNQAMPRNRCAFLALHGAAHMAGDALAATVHLRLQVDQQSCRRPAASKSPTHSPGQTADGALAILSHLDTQRTCDEAHHEPR